VSTKTVRRPGSSAGTCPDDLTTLRAICVVLQALAQKHVPDTAIEDKVNLVQCLKLLREFGVDVTINAKQLAFFHERDIDKNTVSYRRLRSTALAGLSTLADLDKSFRGPPSTEYYRGVHDGCRKASKIAEKFLLELQGITRGPYDVVD
jgi:hypothetical protein